jgi:zinc finger-containing ubiquitin peptidase 1
MRQLGFFAFEKRMPGWLDTLLRETGDVVKEGAVQLIAGRLADAHEVEYAYLCDSSVKQVFKHRGEGMASRSRHAFVCVTVACIHGSLSFHLEGEFCGYRSIQMMATYINHVSVSEQRSSPFGGLIPSIPDIQDLVEGAWNRGICPEGRLETGGIKGTRKYIGTREVQALFTSLAIS